MMQLNSLIHSKREAVNSIVPCMREKKYFADDSFQRRLVWTERQKIRLIETLLMNFPVPEIYLWEQQADPETGTQNSSIVDGQQRLTTIFQFVSNEFPLKENFLDSDNRGVSFSGKFWKDLDDEDKRKIWEYQFNIRSIPNLIAKEEITAIFRRLNETDRSLNPQELRNAEFNGLFIDASMQIADLPFWKTWCVFSTNQIRRMLDIDFSSSLLIFLRDGIVNDSPQSMNKVYDTYNDTYEDKSRDVDEIKKFIEIIEKFLEEKNNLINFLTKPVHLYSLFCVHKIRKDQHISPTLPLEKLEKFILAYEGNEENILIMRYREGASSRTRSKTSREKRVDSLLDWLNYEAK
jgi:hypothetical protein